MIDVRHSSNILDVRCFAGHMDWGTDYQQFQQIASGKEGISTQKEDLSNTLIMTGRVLKW